MIERWPLSMQFNRAATTIQYKRMIMVAACKGGSNVNLINVFIIYKFFDKLSALSFPVSTIIDNGRKNSPFSGDI